MGSFVSKNVRCGLEVNQPGAKGMPVISGSDGVMTLALSSTRTGTGTITMGTIDVGPCPCSGAV